MKEDLVSSAINDFKKNDYVESMMVISKTGVPILGSPPTYSQSDLFSILTGVIFGGAEEILGRSQRNIKFLEIEYTDNRILRMDPAGDKYILVTVFNRKDSNIEKDFADFLRRLEPAFK